MAYDFSRFSEMYRTHDTGIYAIVNAVRQRAYLGATQRGFRVRWQQHRQALAQGGHASDRFQRDWLVDGSAAFAFLVVEEVARGELMAGRGQLWVEQFQAAGVGCYPRDPIREPSVRVWTPSEPLPDGDDLFTPEEVGVHFRVHVRTVYRWLTEGRLSGVHVGHAWRVTRAQVEAFAPTGVGVLR